VEASLESPIREALAEEIRSAAPAGFCYPWGTMSALNGDKARFHRERKNKLARRERSQVLRKKLTPSAPRRPDGRDL
jgi:hypothetical protein